MRVLVTGSRRWTDRRAIEQAFDGVLARWRDPIIVHGGAEGADQFADELAEGFGLRREVYLPDAYRDQGKPAPLARNDAMLDALDPARDLVLAFLLGTPEAGGTQYTILGAKKRRLPVIIHNWPEPAPEPAVPAPPEELAP